MDLATTVVSKEDSHDKQSCFPNPPVVTDIISSHMLDSYKTVAHRIRLLGPTWVFKSQLRQ